MVPANASTKTHTAVKKVDIAELCANIVAKHTSNPVKASLEMCACIALLVCVFAINLCYLALTVLLAAACAPGSAQGAHSECEGVLGPCR